MLRIVIPTVLLLLTAVSAPAPIIETTPNEQAKPKPAEAKTVKKDSPSAPVDKGAIESKLRDLENRFEASIAAHNLSVIEPMIADDAVSVGANGQTRDKSALISFFKADSDTYKSAVNESLSVHVSSPTTAVVMGTVHEKGTHKNGKPFDRMFRFTDTWIERHGRWQCTASQMTKIPLQ